MNVITLADAKARLRALVDQVEAGESVEITRRGKPVARLTGIARARKPVDPAMLQALTATLPATPQRWCARCGMTIAIDAVPRHVAPRRGAVQ